MCISSNNNKEMSKYYHDCHISKYMYQENMIEVTMNSKQ